MRRRRVLLRTARIRRKKMGNPLSRVHRLGETRSFLGQVKGRGGGGTGIPQANLPPFRRGTRRPDPRRRQASPDALGNQGPQARAHP